MFPCPSRGSPRGGGSGRWGAPALHARPRLWLRDRSQDRGRGRSRSLGRWHLPCTEALPSLRPVHGARRNETLWEGERGSPTKSTHPHPKPHCCPLRAPAPDPGPHPPRRRGRLSEAVGSRLAPLCILRDFCSRRQLAKVRKASLDPL